MKDHIILSIINKIEKRKPKEIHKYFQEHAKPRLSKFYKLMANAQNDAQLEKEFIFLKLFGKKYSLREDYLFRNEIRHLKNILEDFLMEEQLNAERKGNPLFEKKFLLQAYKNLGLLDIYKEEHKHISKTAETNGKFHDKIEMNTWMLENASYLIPKMEERKKFMAQIIEETENELQKEINTQVHLINRYKYLHNHFCRLINLKEDFLPVENSVANYKLSDTPSFLSDFYANIGQSYAVPELQIERLLKALHSLDNADKNNIQLQNEKITTQLILATQYSFFGNFTEANNYFEHVFTTYTIDHLIGKENFQLNYCTNSLKLGSYEAALKTIHQMEKTGIENKSLKNLMNILRLIAYLNLRDVKNLFTYLPQDFTDIPFHNKFYYKLIYSCYFYLQNDFESAEREANNLYRSKDTHELLLPFKPLAAFFKTVFEILCERGSLKKLNAHDQKKIQAALKAVDESPDYEVKTLMVYIWLKKEIGL